MQFERNLALLRKKSNMSQEELAFAINVSRQTIYSWEAGLNYPNIVMLKKLADVLEVSTDDLLNGFKVNKLPNIVKDLKLEYVKKHNGEIKYEELPNWFIKLKPNEENCWGLYDKDKGNLVRVISFHICTGGFVKIHDENGIEIEVKHYDQELSLFKKYNQFVSTKDDGVAWIGEVTVENGIKTVKTYKDEDFLKDWGYDKKIQYQKMTYRSAEDWILEYDGKRQNVTKISYFDPDGRDDMEAAYFEVFLNQNNESLVWRRFTKNSLKSKELFTDEEVIISGNKYNMDYYAITSRL